MKKPFIALSFLLLAILLSADISAQSASPTGSPPPAPTPETNTNIAKNLENQPQPTDVSSEKRQKAYQKLLEGQRYLWLMRRPNQGMQAAGLAKNALREAVELDPTLAEAYTALAELAISAPPQDIDEALRFAQIATKLDKDNFGGHRILARLYTIKSNLGRGKLNTAPATQAISEWKEIARLDPRNAEAWAFLSEFYAVQDKQDLQIDALKKWVAAATPLETGFFNRVLENKVELTVEDATFKLGSALLESGDSQGALEILSRSIADDPSNLRTLELFRQSLEGADKDSLPLAAEALRQAAFVNPQNESLIQLLAQTLAKTGQVDDAAKVLRGAVADNFSNNAGSASNLQVVLGDIFAESERTNEAIAAYQNALKIRGIINANLTNNENKDFAILVVGKMIQAYKKANRPDDAKILIEKYRELFGKNDLFADKELINLYRDSGQNPEALEIVRTARKNFPADFGLIRTEASILTALGKVDEGVSLIKDLIEKKPSNFSPSIMYDDYVNYIYISHLYNQSKKTKESIEAANSALKAAQGKEQKQIANIALASAYQMSGDFSSAEEILKRVLNENPGNPIALNNLGYLYLQSDKNFEAALALIKRAIEIEPNNPSYLDSLGWAYYKLGQHELAKATLEKAAKISPNSTTILEHLGDVYKKLGKNTQAKTSWQKALTHTSDTEDINRIKIKISK